MPVATIKPVKRAAKGDNRFCGPAALSIITGIDTAEAAALLRHVTGRRQITGTHAWSMQMALDKLGFKVTSALKANPLKPRENMTLAAWLRSEHRDGRSLYLVAAGHHWQVVQGRRYCCGLTKEIVSIRDPKVKRRARVTQVYRVEAEESIKLADVLPAKPKATRDAARTKARALAKLHNIEIEVERVDGYADIKVWGPAWASALTTLTGDNDMNPHQAILDTLTRARGLIAAGWTRGAFARNANRREVGPRDEKAVCFCIVGAITRAAPREVAIVPGYAARLALLEHLPACMGLAGFNDAAKSKQEVLRLFDKAIATQEVRAAVGEPSGYSYHYGEKEGHL